MQFFKGVSSNVFFIYLRRSADLEDLFGEFGVGGAESVCFFRGLWSPKATGFFCWDFGAAGAVFYFL